MSVVSNEFLSPKRWGRVNSGLPPPSESSRVKIVLGCCWYCWLRLHIKFQTPRIIISSRSRVPGGWWCGVNSNNRLKPNPSLDQVRWSCGQVGVLTINKCVPKEFLNWAIFWQGALEVVNNIIISCFLQLLLELNMDLFGPWS